ncbi:MAG TPA: 3-carboxy-cis,cis-muconate cycloisomerase [Candidatus Dormibacteraeota bacterium]|nr:3-carboxy-cis,cis-muconate cycloisomerase [Candidatus Dormibacteraeota bacterium]
MPPLDALFGSPLVDAVFSDESRLGRMLDFEAALARAEARCGVIPGAAAEVIAGKCKPELLDAAALAQSTKLSANPAIPMVKQLTALVAIQDQYAARFVHWGATSQDVNDTGLVLQIREAWGILDSDLSGFCATLAVMAQQYRSTVILGRTLMQHAQPTTFGAKVAAWLDAMHRHRVRFREIGKRVFVLQFGGAVGTLAALREKGLDVSEALAQELKLELPDIPWHTQRDRLVEVATTLGLCTGTLGKIARDISVHMQPEIAELFEPAGDGRGGSSSMPHKRNPVSAARILAAAIRVPALVSTMLTAMVQEDERGLGNWHAEWETLPEIVRLTAGALHEMKEVMPLLEVDVKKMRSNLDQTHGLVFAEAVSMALAEYMGKSGAHGVVEAASQRVRATGKTLSEELQQNPSVKQVLSTEVLNQLFIPERYLGSAEAFVDRVIASTQQL